MRKTFFDPVRTVISPKALLLQYVAQPDEMLATQSADALLKDAQEVLKKTKGSCGLSSDQVSEVILKALLALKIAAKKYEVENKKLEAACIYQLIESQVNRQIGVGEVYEAPRFR